jgi:hypothetical protein
MTHIAQLSAPESENRTKHKYRRPDLEPKESPQDFSKGKTSPEWPDYLVTPNGCVYRKNYCGRFIKKDYKTPRKKPVYHDPNGYLFVVLCQNNKSKSVWLHSLVLSTFGGPRPEGMLACHINGNPLDCRIENLEWKTHKGNADDTIIHGTRAQGIKNGWAKLTDENVIEMRTLRSSGWKIKALAEKYAVAQCTTDRICKGLSWKHILPFGPHQHFKK